jgi:hypothetical protein
VKDEVISEILGTDTITDTLRLSRNQISGPLPTTLGSMTELEILEVDENLLSGPIPSDLGLGTRLSKSPLSRLFLRPKPLLYLRVFIFLFAGTLDMSKNRFTGHIPTTMSLMTKLGTYYSRYSSFSHHRLL